MKTQRIISILLITWLGLGSNYTSASTIDDQNITEVKGVVKQIYQILEQVNAEAYLAFTADIPDFRYNFNGNSYNHQQVSEIVRSIFKTLLYQKGTIISENYSGLDKSLVLYTARTKWLVKFKDQTMLLQDPWVVQFLFKKENNQWKIISGHESGTEKPVANHELIQKVNQVQLHKKLIGNWVEKNNKDTTVFLTISPYGTGLMGNFRYETHGKAIMEGKQLWGYDKGLDRFIVSEMVKGQENVLYASWFTDQNKSLMLFYNNMNYPAMASYKWVMEFLSPSEFKCIMYQNDKPVRTEIYKKIK